MAALLKKLINDSRAQQGIQDVPEFLESSLSCLGKRKSFVSDMLDSQSRTNFTY